jgi:hypothetical protein
MVGGAVEDAGCRHGSSTLWSEGARSEFAAKPAIHLQACGYLSDTDDERRVRMGRAGLLTALVRLPPPQQA